MALHRTALWYMLPYFFASNHVSYVMCCATCVPRNRCQQIALVGLGTGKLLCATMQEYGMSSRVTCSWNEKHEIWSWKERVIGITLKPET